MFTGIVRAIGHITEIERLEKLLKFTVTVKEDKLLNLQKGASISVNGVCLTVTKLTPNSASFDVIEETLNCTTLSSLNLGSLVNIERAACIGDEIGGHLLSGHIQSTITVDRIQRLPNNCKVTFKVLKEWMKYLFPKGYVAINGASLTIVDVNPEASTFSVCLIPETLENTTFNAIKEQDRANLEIDSQTQVIVDTVISTLSR